MTLTLFLSISVLRFQRSSKYIKPTANMSTFLSYLFSNSFEIGNKVNMLQHNFEHYKHVNVPAATAKVFSPAQEPCTVWFLYKLFSRLSSPHLDCPQWPDQSLRSLFYLPETWCWQAKHGHENKVTDSTSEKSWPMISLIHAHLQISVDEVFGVNVCNSTDYLLSKSQTIHSSLVVWIQSIPFVYPLFQCLVTQFHLNVEVLCVRQTLCWTWNQMEIINVQIISEVKSALGCLTTSPHDLSVGWTQYQSLVLKVTKFALVFDTYYEPLELPAPLSTSYRFSSSQQVK